MGDPKKRRKRYETPRKKWDKQLLETEKKLLEFYGLVNKRDLRKHITWLKNKRQIARGLLALPLEERNIREKELMSGLKKYGLANDNTSVEDILSMKVEAVLERRLQTQVMRKGMANSSKQARQFIVHGHISLGGNKLTAPSYLVSMEEPAQISWYKKPIKIDVVQKKDLKKAFEEAAGITAEEKLIESTEPLEEIVQEIEEKEIKKEDGELKT